MGTAQYDSIGGAYDRVARLDLYHRLFWGVSTKAYGDFARRADEVCRTGLFLDAGCGSMLFTAAALRASRRAFAVDISAEMLKRAQRRLHQAQGAAFLLQADLLRLPFGAHLFDGVVCLHVAHVTSDLATLLRALRSVIKPGGRLFLTSVVLVGHLRDSYLRLLARRGIMAQPRSADAVIAALRDTFGAEPQRHTIGNMLFTETVAP